MGTTKLEEVAALATVFENYATDCEKSAARMTATQLQASLKGEARGWRNAAYILTHLLKAHDDSLADLLALHAALTAKADATPPAA